MTKTKGKNYGKIATNELMEGNGKLYTIANTNGTPEFVDCFKCKTISIQIESRCLTKTTTMTTMTTMTMMLMKGKKKEINACIFMYM